MLVMNGYGRKPRVAWLWRAGVSLLLSLQLAGCGVIGDVAWPEATVTLVAGQATPTATAEEIVWSGATPTQTSVVATSPAQQPAATATGVGGAGGLPITLSVPEGWTLREIPQGLIVLEDGASLASAELECPVLLVRRVPEAGNRADLLASYALAGVLRRRQIPLVIAGYPVDALDITVSGPVTGRIYQVVLAPLMLKGDGLLFIASMPQGQASHAWPILAGILGSVAPTDD